MLAAPRDQLVHLAFIDVLHRHRVDLHCKTGILGGENAVHRLVQPSPAGDFGKFGGVERVQTHIHPPHTGLRQIAGKAGELRAVGGQRQLAQAVAEPRTQRLEQLDHIAAHQRLTTGDADFIGAQANERPAEPLHFLQRQQIRLG